jgi:DNA adenine methylase
LKLLEQCDNFLPDQSLIYLDPPYYVKGRGLYRNYYQHEDHQAIAKTLQSLYFARSWVVSYDNAAEIREMYQLSRGLSYGLNYTAQKRYVGNEVMFFSETLRVPDEAIPRSKFVA